MPENVTVLSERYVGASGVVIVGASGTDTVPTAGIVGVVPILIVGAVGNVKAGSVTEKSSMTIAGIVSVSAVGCPDGRLNATVGRSGNGLTVGTTGADIDVQFNDIVGGVYRAPFSAFVNPVSASCAFCA